MGFSNDRRGGGGSGGDVGGDDRNNKTFATSDRARLREKPPPACFAPAWLVTAIRPVEHVRNPLTAARCGLSLIAEPVATRTMWPRIVKLN